MIMAVVIVNINAAIGILSANGYFAEPISILLFVEDEKLPSTISDVLFFLVNIRVTLQQIGFI